MSAATLALWCAAAVVWAVNAVLALSLAEWWLLRNTRDALVRAMQGER